MNLIQALQDLQARHGYLREQDLRELAARDRLPLYEIQAVASFYPHFRRTPPPRVEVAVCRDLCCAMSGAAEARARIEAAADARADVEVRSVSCLGRCDRAPACLADDRPVSAHQALAICLGELAAAEVAPSPTPQAAALVCDPYREGEDTPHYAVLRDLVASGDLAGVAERLEAAGLRGMGGAGFPTGRKWALVRDQPAGPRVVICNADESEPGTFKDRALLEWAPHLVVEGLVIGALCVGAEEGWVYIRHEYAAERERLLAAIADAAAAGVLGEDVCGSGRRFSLRVFVSPGGYILGEETALLEALEGRRGEPRHKPPYPGEKGLHGLPTLINNVETLALVPYVLRMGRSDRKLFSVSGDVRRPGVHEVEVGTCLRELIALCGGMRGDRPLQAFLPGGASTGFLGPEHQDVPLTFEDLQAAGSALGSGAVVVIAEGNDLLALAGSLAAFFRNESCGKCVPCRLGTEKAVRVLEAARGRTLSEQERALLADLDAALRDTSICGLGQVALTPLMTALERLSAAGRS
jgi:NADH:ubiquinone oxidoreductase subunit F (NADH-binding)/NADH:ubiquinone oxidoreductase subunit E